MMHQDSALVEYRSQLNRWVEAMAVNDVEAIEADAADGYLAGDVELFTVGNLDKRADILALQLSSIAEAFNDLEELIDEYIATQPLAAFTAGPADAAAFLRWLGETRDLTAEQIDHLACRQARYDVEDAARGNRSEHVRFQERLSVAKQLGRQLHRNRRLKVHLNPARGWALLHTRELLDDHTKLPGNVVFFAVGTKIHSAVLDHPVPQLLHILADGPLTFDEWLRRAGVSMSGDLLAVVRRLAEIGLLAFS